MVVNGKSILFFLNLLKFKGSTTKKSCQGCELPSDDIPDSTSNVRGQNNNTPSATNNNQTSEYFYINIYTSSS